MDRETKAQLQKLPSVQSLLETEQARLLLQVWPRSQVVEALRRALEAEREAVLGGDRASAPRPPKELLNQAEGILHRLHWPGLRPAINATGVVLHTGLGRAPLSQRAVERVAAVSGGNCALEVDLDSGGRGRRHQAVSEKMRRLTGAEDTLVVNNNAAAVLLALETLARGCRVAVSRGELVEIGGAFRIPEVLERSGALLVEVGTTNRTHVKDYREAVEAGVDLLLKVHPSNYKVRGFTADVSAEELVALGREYSLPVVYDLGSGVLLEQGPDQLGSEPTVLSAMDAGVDLVTFSGDKLLGGPQAGIIVGQRDTIRCLEANHLSRALRPDKMALAALEATLELYLEERWEELPALRMLTSGEEEVKWRAEGALELIRTTAPSVEADLVPLESEVGGGSLPLTRLPSWGVALRRPGLDANTLAARMRQQEMPCFGRIMQERLVLDLRTVAPGEEEEMARVVRRAAGEDSNEGAAH